MVWIEFMTSMDATKFLNTVAKYDVDFNSMYHRMVKRYDCDDPKKAWRYDANVDDFALEDIFDDEGEEIIDEKMNGAPDFVLGISVRFPRSDLEAVKKIVEEAVDA